MPVQPPGPEGPALVRTGLQRLRRDADRLQLPPDLVRRRPDPVRLVAAGPEGRRTEGAATCGRRRRPGTAASPRGRLSTDGRRALRTAGPEPATRSFTVVDTSTSPAPACAEMRAPTCTAMPLTFAPAFSTSPVCRPARRSRPMSRAARTMAAAQRTARAGPSKVAKSPSPAVSISRPRWASSSLLAMARNRCWRSRQALSPRRTAISVEPTMSANSTVASQRSSPRASWRADVAVPKHTIASRSRSVSPS